MSFKLIGLFFSLFFLVQNQTLATSKYELNNEFILLTVPHFIEVSSEIRSTDTHCDIDVKLCKYICCYIVYRFGHEIRNL